MAPTFAQRLGVRPLRLPLDERRMLVSARAASLGFAVQAVLAFAAAAAGGELGLVAAVAVIASCSLGLLIICRYDRLPRSVNRLLALAATLIVALLTVEQPAGDRYALLYVGVVVYVSFFFSRTQALMQLAAAASLWAAVLASTKPLDEAAAAWILGAGTLVATALVTRVMRDSLIAAAERARAHRRVLDAFFLNAPAGFAFLDEELRHVRVNEPLAAIFGVPAEDLVGKSLRELVPHHADALEPLLRAVLESGEGVTNLELTSADGQRHYLVSFYAIDGPEGRRGIGETIVQVTHLKNVERRLEETNRQLTVLASTDELTQLPNRRKLAEQLELALERARTGDRAVALLCLDLDRFKEVNDMLGHGYGDQMLVEVARRLRAAARESDVVARVGGDEFVVLLTDLDVRQAPELAALVAGRIRALFLEPIAIDSVELRAKACIGVAVYPTDSRDAKGLLAAADAAMYASKHAFTRVA
jgi:diguanylate cyclase (GGDEF)-like protein/PAS domain S-box-containing protein